MLQSLDITNLPLIDTNKWDFFCINKTSCIKMYFF